MIYIIISSLLYTIAIIFGSLASRNANTNLVAAIINTISAVIPFAIAIPVLNAKTFNQSKLGLMYAVIAGILIALFTMALGKSYSVNKVAVVVPVVFGGAIFLSAILSYFIFNEKISRLQAIGLFFLAVGFCIIIYSRWSGK